METPHILNWVQYYQSPNSPFLSLWVLNLSKCTSSLKNELNHRYFNLHFLWVDKDPENLLECAVELQVLNSYQSLEIAVVVLMASSLAPIIRVHSQSKRHHLSSLGSKVKGSPWYFDQNHTL